MNSPKRLSGTFWQWIGVPLGIGLLYVLSVGPAVRLSEDGWLSKTSVTKLYRPLRIIRGTPMEKLLNTYLRFWLPPPGRPMLLLTGFDAFFRDPNVKFSE